MPHLTFWHFVLFGFGFVGLVCCWHLLRDHGRAARLRTAAGGLGLEYRGTDRSFFDAHLAPAAAFAGQHPSVKNLMVGQYRGREVRVFDLSMFAPSLVEQTVIGVRGAPVA